MVVQNKEENKGKKRGELIAICSAKGGVGKTTIAINLAVALCKKNIAISIIDGDFQFGDVSLALDIQSTFTIKDVIEEGDNLDQHSLVNFLNHHESGLKVLSAPERPEYADLVKEAEVSKILDLLLMQHDYVIADTGVGLQENTLSILEKADQILVVTNLEMTTLKNSKLMLETLYLLGLREKVTTIINRSTMESVIQASDVSSILEDDQPFYIPNDFQTASQSINIGIPFVQNHGKTEIAKAIFKMAEHLSSRREIRPIPVKKPSLISKFFEKAKMIKEESSS